MNNPYFRNNFFEFFGTFVQRLLGFLTGEIPLDAMASDELQIAVLVGISASAALVGTFLMLRRMTMLANSLSHTVLLGIVIAYLISTYGGSSSQETYHQPLSTQAMLLAAMAMGLVTTFLTEFLTSTVRIQSDAANGLVFTTLFALGVILVTLFTRNVHVGTEVVMGNVNLLHFSDLKLVLWVLLINLFCITIFFKELKVTTFDPALARSLGISSVFFNYLLMTQSSLTAVGAFRAVGVLMVLAFIIAPPLTMRLLTHNLARLLAGSMLIGALASVVGVALSRHILSVYRMPLSTAGVVVCVITGFYVLALLFAPERGIIAQLFLRRQLRKRISR